MQFQFPCCWNFHVLLLRVLLSRAKEHRPDCLCQTGFSVLSKPALQEVRQVLFSYWTSILLLNFQIMSVPIPQRISIRHSDKRLADDDIRCTAYQFARLHAADVIDIFTLFHQWFGIFYKLISLFFFCSDI